jgi:putative MATE family efflux protein
MISGMSRFLRTLFNRPLMARAMKLAFPVVGSYLCVATVMGFELWTVGRLGPEAVAAVGLGSWLFLVMLMGFHGLEIGCQTIVARRFGEKKWGQVGSVLTNSLVLAIIIGGLLTWFLWRFGPYFLRTSDPEVARHATWYFKIRLFSLAPLLVVLTLIGFYNGIARAHVPMYSYFVSMIVNMVLLYGMVLGKFGLPALGTSGAALASVLSSLLGLLLMVLPLVHRGMRTHFALFQLEHISRDMLKRIAVLSTPIFIQQLMVHIALFVFLRINASISTVALATSSIVMTVANFSFLPALGFGIAAATMMSQNLGACNPQRASISTQICLAMALAFMVSLGIGFALGGKWIMHFYIERSATAATADAAIIHAEVIRLGAIVLIIIGLLQAFDALGMVFAKAMQGAGLTRYVMITETLILWGLLVPLAYVLGIVFGWGVIGTWIAYGAFLIVYGIIMLWKFRRGEWQHVRL